jgi:hypothetical protein
MDASLPFSRTTREISPDYSIRQPGRLGAFIQSGAQIRKLGKTLKKAG